MDKKKELEKMREAALGWDKPGGYNEIFERLKASAGDRGFTFLGRTVGPEDTFADVLKRIPAAELEEGGSVSKVIRSPDSIRGFGGIDPFSSLYAILSEPLIRQPGGLIKFLRRKLQEYKDPEGEVMTPRPAQGKHWQQMDLLTKMLADEVRGVDKALTYEHVLLRIKKNALLEDPRLLNKSHPDHLRLTTELKLVNIDLGEME
jgi:hypothetical protein